MKKIWNLLKSHWQEDFQLTYYASLALFLGGAISVNYYLGLENEIIDRHPDNPIRILWYFLLYGFMYYGAALLMIRFKHKGYLLRSKKFWLLSLVGILLVAVNTGFPFIHDMLRQLEVDIRIYLWLFSTTNNLIGFVVTALPLVFLHHLTQSGTHHYGLQFKGFDTAPYFKMLLIVLPFIVVASFENSFQNYYPTYKTNVVAETLGWPWWLPPFIYEFVYGLDFFNTEFLFRGFMVIGLTQVLGKDAILPMVATYCALHFGKPVGEAIGSIYGGYILGVIAFYTRSIWGGVMIHVGLAWMMELAAYLQKIY